MVSGVLATAKKHGVAAQEIGKVTRDNQLRIEYKGRAVVSAPVTALHDVWAHGLERALKLQ